MRAVVIKLKIKKKRRKKITIENPEILVDRILSLLPQGYTNTIENSIDKSLRSI